MTQGHHKSDPGNNVWPGRRLRRLTNRRISFDEFQDARILVQLARKSSPSGGTGGTRFTRGRTIYNHFIWLGVPQHLAKVGVEGSNPFARSNVSKHLQAKINNFFGVFPLECQGNFLCSCWVHLTKSRSLSYFRSSAMLSSVIATFICFS